MMPVSLLREDHLLLAILLFLRGGCLESQGHPCPCPYPVRVTLHDGHPNYRTGHHPKAIFHQTKKTHEIPVGFVHHHRDSTLQFHP
jgi:hypothetical protein